MRRIAIGLLHHPVIDRSAEVFTTMLTSLDVHDLARAGRAYDVAAFYVVHPQASQRLLAERIAKHWTEGGGRRRIPDRAEALELVRVVADLDAVARDFGDHELWTTAARAHGQLVSFADARRELTSDGLPVLIAFGTGWGLGPEVHARADRRLEPIVGRHARYNHLSVRAAAAIVLDRLLG